MNIKRFTAVAIAAAMVLSMTACANSENPNDGTENVSGNIKIKTDYKAMWKVLPEIEETPIENLVYEYDVKLAGMTVTGYKAQSPKVRIPDKIEGEPVVGVNLKDSTITEIIMPDTVKRAVLNKTCLQYANYPLSLDTNEAFNGSAIEAIYIPKGITAIPSSAFKNCSSLKTINLPEGITAIPDSAFENCRSLQTINLPDTLTSLEHSCFYNCNSLKSLTLPDNVSYLGSYWIYDADIEDYAAVITYKGKNYTPEKYNELYYLVCYRDGLMIKDGVLLDSIEDISEAVIPDTVTKINKGAFSNRKNLRSVIIPNSVIEIGSSAFSGSENVVVTYKGKTYNYEHLSDLLFDAINLGESGMLIENGVLKDVSKELTEVVIPDNTTIIENAFQGCINLVKVTLPDTAHTIDKSAFEDCTNVKVTYKGKTYNYEQLEDLYNLINYGDSSISALKVLTYPTKGYTPPFEMSSKGVYMVNLDTYSVIVSQNSNEKLYPNSTTMIMTCLVALENVKDFNAKVNCPYDCFNEFHSGNLNFMGTSNVGIEPMQDNLTYWDCINAIMLGSGCEAANIIAYNVGGGSIDNFVDMMNKTAQKIGCKNTHFSNAHGLFDEDNYTTAYDLYLITKYAIDNLPGFTEICNTHQYDMPSNSSNPNGYSITPIMAGSIDKYYLKNGNAISETRSLVTTETQNGYAYLIVTLGAPYNSYAYDDHNNLYYWVSDNFEYKRIVDDNQLVTSATVKNGVSYSIDVVTEGALYWLIPKNSELTVNKVMPNIDPILAPVREGKYVGYLEVRLGEEIIARVPLVTKGVVLRQDADDTSN